MAQKLTTKSSFASLPETNRATKRKTRQEKMKLLDAPEKDERLHS